MDTNRSGLLAAAAIALLLSGCAAQVARVETPRLPDVAPAPQVERAIAEYKARDPDASFTLVGGHVDAYATSAKEQVPDYALPILVELGLSTTARPVRRLLSPTRLRSPRATSTRAVSAFRS